MAAATPCRQSTIHPGSLASRSADLPGAADAFVSSFSSRGLSASRCTPLVFHSGNAGILADVPAFIRPLWTSDRRRRPLQLLRPELREQDSLPDRREIAEQHDQPVDADAEAGVGRQAELERAQVG